MVSGTFCGQSAESIAYSDRTKSSIGLFLAQLVSHQKNGQSSKGTFPSRDTFRKLVKALRKFSPVCPFDSAVKSFKIWGEMPSNSALQPLRKDMRAFWKKTPRLKNNRYLWGPEQSKFPSADVSA